MNVSLQDSRHLTALLSLLLLVMTLAVFWPVHQAEFIPDYDDSFYITDNHRVQAGLTRDNILWAFTTFYALNWHPLTWLSHMLDVELYGLNPAGHHLTNLLLHMGNVLLLFWVLRRMTGRPWPSAVVAALFAVHPLNVESVAWVAERKNVLSTLFWLLTLAAYVRYVEHPSLRRYLLVALVLALGLMAKPMLVTVPVVLLLLDYWPLRRYEQQNLKELRRLKVAWKLVWEKMPLFALAAASSVVTYLAQQEGGALRSLESYPVWVRIDNALVSYVGYIAKMIWPHGLVIPYPHPGPNLPWWQPAGAAVCLTGVSILVSCLRHRWPYLVVGWFWYLVTLLPVIGLVQLQDQAMADRYAYVPLIGLFIMIVWGALALTVTWHYRRAVLAIAAGVVLVVLMTVCRFQVAKWHSSATLFDAWRAIYGQYAVHNDLGLVLLKQGKVEEAIGHFALFLQMWPEYADAHDNLGLALAKQGKFDEAIAHYMEALRIKPGLVEAHYNLGLALANQGKFEEAIHDYLAAVRLNPNFPQAHDNLGIAYEKLGQLDEAIDEYKAALALQPDFPDASNNLGGALMEGGRYEEAIRAFQTTLNLHPDNAVVNNNLGSAYLLQGRLKEAIGEFEHARALQAGNAQLHYNLAVAYQQVGRTRDAKEALEQALRVDPGFRPAAEALRRLFP